jgi:hypothetical protein
MLGMNHKMMLCFDKSFSHFNDFRYGYIIQTLNDKGRANIHFGEHKRKLGIVDQFAIRKDVVVHIGYEDRDTASFDSHV